MTYEQLQALPFGTPLYIVTADNFFTVQLMPGEVRPAALRPQQKQAWIKSGPGYVAARADRAFLTKEEAALWLDARLDHMTRTFFASSSAI